MGTELRLKGASGLGDSIYLYPAAKHFSERFDKIYLMSDYPELFETLPKVECVHHCKGPIAGKPADVRCTYGAGKYTPGTSQFTDYIRFAGISQDLPLEIPWETKDREFIDSIKRAAGPKKLCILAAPYQPFGREDKWGTIMCISPEVMQTIVDTFSYKIFFLQIGNRFCLHHINNVDMDLVDKTTVSQLMDLVANCDLTISQIGNLLPMSEALNKKNFLIFSRRALRLKGIDKESKFISAITPEKTVHKKNLNVSVDDRQDMEHILRRFDCLTQL